MTERLRISIHISNYFQTLEFLEKTLSDKNEPLGVWAVKNISHPIIRLGSHSFIAPFYILVFAPNICLAATMYKQIRAQYISDVLAVKIISHPILRLGSHSFIAPFYILVLALNIYLAATIYKYPRSRHLGRFRR